MTSAPPGGPGWYADPACRFDERYWDGTDWTPAVKRGEHVESDPEPVLIESASPTTPSPLGAGPQARPGAGPREGPLGAVDGRWISLPPTEAQSEVVRLLSAAGIPIQGQQPGLVRAVVRFRGKPNVLRAILLDALCIIPGIIYLIRASRPRMLPADVYLVPTSPGTTSITIKAAPEARQALLSVLAALP
jgi:hypothetical protein